MDKTLKVSFTLFFLVSFQSVSGGDSIHFEFRTGMFTNMYYQLNVLGGQITGSQNAYRELWDKKLDFTSKDDSLLKHWSQLLSKYSEQINVNKDSYGALPYPLNFPSYYEPVQKIHLAGLGAADLTDFKRRLELIVQPADVDEMADIFNHFENRFSVWWDVEGLALVKPSADSMRTIVNGFQLEDFSAKVAAFYGAVIPKGQVMIFHLLARPLTIEEAESGRQHTSGTVIENQSLVEVLSKENPKKRLDVVLHELFHYFYGAIPPETHASIQLWFSNSGYPNASAHYAYMNEILATSLGNGIVTKMLSDEKWFDKYRTTPNSFYHNEYIDVCAKALLDTMEILLKSGYTLKPDMASWYLPMMNDALGDQKMTPKFLLSGRYMYAWESEMKLLLNQFNKRVRAVSISMNSEDETEWEIETGKRMTAVFFIEYKNLHLLDKKSTVFPKNVRADIKKLAKTNGAFVYCFKGTDNEMRYVFTGKDRPSVEQAMNKFITENKPCERACCLSKQIVGK